MPTLDKNKFNTDQGLRVLSLAEISDEIIGSTKFEILKTGQYYDPRYGKFTIDREKLLTLKRNFDSNVLEIDVAVDANHEPEKGALAWIKELMVEGESLFMTVKDVTSEGKKVLKDKIFKYFSVEFAPFTKVADGKKVTVSDVLRGVALTNRPVIKGMAATFYSEDAKSFIHNSNMSVFTKLAETLKGRSKVTSDDLALAKSVFAELSEEEQTEAQPAMDEVEAKAEATAEAEAKTAEEAKATADAEAAKAKADADAEPEAVQAAEAKAKEAETKLSEANALIEKFQSEKKEKTLSEAVSSVMLSEGKAHGFNKTKQEALKAFLSELSEEQVTAFSELMKDYSVVDVRELGSGSDGMGFAEGKVRVGATDYSVKDADVDAEIRSLAEREKLSYFDAARKYAETAK